MNERNLNMDTIICTLLNTKRNRPLLKMVPHLEIGDMSIVFRKFVMFTKEDMADHNYELLNMPLVTNHDFQELDVSFQQLFEQAMDNTHNLLPVLIQGSQFWENFCTKVDIHLDDDERQLLLDSPLHIVTNKHMKYASIGLLSIGLFSQFAEIHNSDLIIIPSSIHELLFFKSDISETSLKNCLEQIKEVNSTLPPNIILSDAVYYYSRETQTISMFTDEGFVIIAKGN